MVRFFAGDLATGLVRVPSIPVTGGSSTATLNDAGTLSCTLKLPLTDPITGTSIAFPGPIAVARSYLAVEDRGVIHNAGPIWNVAYDKDSRQLTINAAGAASYFAYRYVLPALTDSSSSSTPSGQTVTYSSLALRTIAKRLVQQAQAATHGTLPISFEADISDTNTRTYTGESLTRILDALQDIANVQNGPDWLFAPVMTDPTHLGWNFLTGVPLAQAGADLPFDTTVPTPTVFGVTVGVDGSQLVTDDYELGGQDSSGNDLWAKSHDDTLLNAGFLRMESSGSHNSVTDAATLQQYANAATITGEFYASSWALKTRKALPPTSDTIQPGYFAQVVTKGDPFIPDGRNRIRIMSTSIASGDRTMSLTCAPEQVHA